MEIIYTVVTVGVSAIPKTDLVLAVDDSFYSCQERAIRAALAGNVDTDPVLVSSLATAGIYSSSGYAAEALNATTGGSGSIYVFLCTCKRSDNSAEINTVYAKAHVRADGAVAWSSVTAYVTGDTAIQSGHTYRALNGNTNQDPTGAGAAHWVIDDASPAEWAVHCALIDALAAAYISGQTYNVREQAYEAGYGTYESLIDNNTGNTPHSSPGDWELVPAPACESVVALGIGPLTIVI